MRWQHGERQRLKVGDAHLESICYGPAPGIAPTIVLLHEGLGCVTMWRDFPERLAEATGWGVFAFSRQGYGGSDSSALPRPADYLEQEARDVVADLLNAIGYRNGILLGHSDGASIAGLYLGSHQDHRIRGLVMMAPHFFTEESNLVTIRQVRQQYETTDLRERLARHHGENVDCAFYGWADTWLNPDFANWNATDVIGYVRVPILYIQGEDDPYGSKAQADAVVDESYAPVELHILSDCQHAPHLEHPQKTMAIISDFIARLERIEGQGIEGQGVDPA